MISCGNNRAIKQTEVNIGKQKSRGWLHKATRHVT